ncbi:MAG: acetate--CoA ligase [Taibaiella sp.]|nr:acetate--CoA ligase [Taibaiella sp.]
MEQTTRHYPYQVLTAEEYEIAYRKSIDDPEAFWGDVASHFAWRRKWDNVVTSDFTVPRTEWFGNARLNIAENCLDRHLNTIGNRPAIIWEPNDPDTHYRSLTYKELYKKVCQFSYVLRNNGVKKGDRVCIYMGMIPELAVAMLACARIGAVHTVIFGGFSAQSIADRLQDAKAEIIVTADGAYRGPKSIPLKDVIDDALPVCPFVKRVIVCTHLRNPVSMIKGRDVWWEDEIKKVETQGWKHYAAEEMDAEDPLFILYTSGSTGKPKGVVHSTAGYMVYTCYSFVNVFNYQPGDVFFCTADMGWITGHSYLLYGALLSGATSLMYEGIPTWPDAGRMWNIVDKHKVNILYTAPTALRSLMSFGREPLADKDLSSLKVLGTVGEPINDEAWQWYYKEIGKERCPIVDTWWQTETGGIMISNMAGITPAKPTYATLPMPGVELVLVNEKGHVLPGNDVSGILCIRSAWPSLLRTTYNDHEKYYRNYFAPYPGMYFTGDGAYRDENGLYRITGRIDDVLNVSGHRIGSAEVENAINMHTGVTESAVVGYPHEIKGEGIYAYVVYEKPVTDADLIRRDILQTVSRVIGPIARPDKVQFVSALPKTRSGKIMRRILRKIAESDTTNLGDLTTLTDPTIVDELTAGRIE